MQSVLLVPVPLPLRLARTAFIIIQCKNWAYSKSVCPFTIAKSLPTCYKVPGIPNLSTFYLKFSICFDVDCNTVPIPSLPRGSAGGSKDLVLLICLSFISR